MLAVRVDFFVFADLGVRFGQRALVQFVRPHLHAEHRFDIFTASIKAVVGALLQLLHAIETLHYFGADVIRQRLDQLIGRTGFDRFLSDWNDRVFAESGRFQAGVGCTFAQAVNVPMIGRKPPDSGLA